MGKEGINGRRDYAILTAEISKATFGMTPNEYRSRKNISTQSKINLRDHMDDLELIFTMLGERLTTEISQEEKPATFYENKNVAKRGGSVAGDARKNAEREFDRSIVTDKNFLKNNHKEKIIR
ncbi:MAG: DNA-damage-inducible protein D [Patescibacteria group bacterium]|jgi:DNA-damage-inducible protein D